MEEKERSYDRPTGVPGGHNLQEEECISDVPTNGHDDDRRKEFKPGGQCLTLPRYVKANEDGNCDENGELSRLDSHISSRKVDSLPSNITMLSYEQDNKKKKGVLKSVGYFFQKLTRRLSFANSNNGMKLKLNQRGSSSTTSSNSSGCNGSTNDNNGVQGGRKSGHSSATGSIHALDCTSSGPNLQPQASSARFITLDELPGMIGIHNHGNTCFMNAIIQCLSNTEPLLSYFLCDQYKEDIKRANKHNSKRFGTKGELTEHLATLLKSLWLKMYKADISTEFKTIVAKYGSQYRGSFQHDVQEFLIWLLDKVHEDLNIAAKKKYRANKGSFGRTDEDVAAEAMANHARCDNSFIHDLFQALYRSSLTCPTCRHQSNTFDPFLSVSLPIPRTSLVQPVLATCLRSDGSTRVVRRKVGVVLEKGHTVKDLKEELVKDATIFRNLSPSQVMILEVTGKKEFHILEDCRLLSDPLNDEHLYAIDISPHLPATPDKNQCASLRLVGDRLEPTADATDLNSKPTNGYAGEIHPADVIGREQVGFSKPDDVVLQNGDEGAGLVLVVLNSFSGGDNETRLTTPSIFRHPVTTVTVSHLDYIVKNAFQIDQGQKVKYFIISETGSSKFSKVELMKDPEVQIPCDGVERSENETTIASCSNTIPLFRLLVEWSDPSLSSCFDFPADIEEDESVEVVKNLQHQSNAGTLDECFQVYTQEEKLGENNDWYCPNCKSLKQGATKSLTLWSLPEILVIHLKRFRQDHEHRSKLNTLILFPLTGLDLRQHMPRDRVEGGDSVDEAAAALGGNWNAAMQLKSSKQQSSWLSWRLGCKSEGSVYDLYAVCNHYGDMQGGHYTAFCRNPVANTWCLFNDNRATPIREGDVVTRAAYLLFYQKRSTTCRPEHNIPGPEVDVDDGVVDVIKSCNGNADPRSTDVPPDGRKKAPPESTFNCTFPPRQTSTQPSSPTPSESATVPMSSVESRPWLVSLLEERRKLHGLSHTITQTENSHRISRAITSHSLDDLLDGDCDEPRDSHFGNIPIYTTLHPPPRIIRQAAKAPMAMVSTDSIPMASVGDGPSQSKCNGTSVALSSEKIFSEESQMNTKSITSPPGIPQEMPVASTRAPKSEVKPGNPVPIKNGPIVASVANGNGSKNTDRSSCNLKPMKPNPVFPEHRFFDGID